MPPYACSLSCRCPTSDSETYPASSAIQSATHEPDEGNVLAYIGPGVHTIGYRYRAQIRSDRKQQIAAAGHSSGTFSPSRNLHVLHLGIIEPKSTAIYVPDADEVLALICVELCHPLAAGDQ